MLRRLFNKCLLRPSDLPPSRAEMEVIGTFNPGVVATEDGVVILVRVAEQTREKRAGQTALPRWDVSKREVVVDWVADTEVEPVDVRVMKLKTSGTVRLTFISHLRVIHSRDGRNIDSIEGAQFWPEDGNEEYGVEDPRITRIGDTFYITYVAVSRHGAATALASTRDFRSFERLGIIFPIENKDVLLFPGRIGGSYRALHRPNGATPFTKPEMWTATSPDLIHWGGHQPLLGGVGGGWDLGRIGGGAPPIRTPGGWMELYHGNSRREDEGGIGVYSGGLLLLDLEDPRRIVGRSGQVFVPEAEFERAGFVPNVVFPTGIVEQGENLLVYYGAADTFTAVVEFAMEDVLGAIKAV